MAEIRRGLGGDALGGERLPWLEPVEDETEEEPRGGYGGIALLGIAALVVIGLVIAGVVMVRHWRAGHSDMGQIIHAPAGPYKEKPSDPGGLQVDQAGIVAERTGTGGDINSPLDLAAIPEQPVTGPGSVPPAAIPAAAPTQTGKPAAAVAAPAPAQASPVVAKAPPPAAAAPTPETPPAVAVGESGTIQLGAFSSQAKAKAAWKSLSTRFTFLSPMTMAIIPVKSGEATLYRLRASGGASAASVCAKLKVAGETCVITG